MGGGLTAILPQPKHASKIVTKITAPAPQTMIPYTLSKRAQAAAKRQKKPSTTLRNTTKPSTGDAEDSDSDGEPVSFFSHLDPTVPISDPLSGNIPASESHPSTTATPNSIDPSALSTVSDHSADLSILSTISDLPPPVEAAPSAPRPFSLREEVNYVDPLSEWDVHTEEDTTDERYSKEANKDEGGSVLLGAGPGLSMDQQAVSSHNYCHVGLIYDVIPAVS